MEDETDVVDKQENNDADYETNIEKGNVEPAVESSTHLATVEHEEIMEEAESEIQLAEEQELEPIATTDFDDAGVHQVESFSYMDYENGEEGEEEFEEITTEESSTISGELANLNEKLDRSRLEEIFKEVNIRKRHTERRKNLLNRKVSEYYRRQQHYGVFLQESVGIQKDYLQKYKNLLLELDVRMANKLQSEIDSKNQIEPLKQAIQQNQVEYEKNCQSFAKLFYDTAITLQGGTTGKELKETTVLNIVKRMANIRNIINRERFTFIKTQNMVAEIEVKAKSLEDLGDGLRMIDFEQLRSETQSLSDKIEERNNELEKLRLRCNSDTQILAHVREKDFMLNNIIEQQRDLLYERLEDVSMEREQCNEIKVERDMYRKKHNDMSIECGLLDKPPLLRDFDITVEKIEEKTKEIARLRMENEKIEKEVHKIAVILSEGELIKTNVQKFEEKLLEEISYMDAPIYPRIKKNVTERHCF